MSLLGPTENARKAEQLLLQQETLLALVDHMFESVYVLDAEGRWMYGRSCRTELASGTVREMEEYISGIEPEHQSHVRQALDLALKGKVPSTVEYRSVRDDGDVVWYEGRGFCIGGGEQAKENTCIWAVKEITERKLLEEELVRMAFHDPLTELPNRRLFQVQLNQSLAYAKRNRQLLAVLSLDIDDFKMINDSFGHEIGDEFLRAFANRVKRCVREVDMFARIGGDEFSILLPKIESVDSIQLVTHRILSAIRKGWDIGSRTLQSTVSMGVAVFPADGSDADTLLRNVDLAMYQVKAGGRDGCLFYNSQIG
ncbi:sensor domain-containing diguanylate cyclase [Paenibacillus thalictri]|uniref:Diguanylate cyclase n=1 Tax=Paenibacillus thalictri TaxID=2527873 RepID=A0A4Q9DIW8_9BACL|nr:sensor domain-containing diguanylate cyclase [Paenibacillus thalictri]TBL72675.1 diguanylate cyclase [Paenibacillus thalictri]